MKTILVPTDFSKAAQSAINYAMGMAKQEKAKLVLLHSFEIVYAAPDVSIEIIAAGREAMMESSHKKMKALCAKIKAQKISCESIIKQGFTVDSILNTAQKLRPFLIVMGTKGASGIKKVLMGSNTASVIQKAQCPVIAVPEGLKYKAIKKITFATNYYSSDMVAIKKLVEIAEPFRAAVNILHISDGEFIPAEEELLLKQLAEKVTRKINYNNFSFQLIYAKNVEKELEKYIAEKSTDIIALSTQQRNLIEKLFGRSVTRQMAFHTAVPLLAFHHKAPSMVLI